MTNNSNRLDRIEDDLETVKEILVAVARRAESTDELDRLAKDKSVPRCSSINLAAALINSMKMLRCLPDD